ncbi:tyrosine-type recombinase/integrase [Ferrovibrio sp.]|uniref:tyrosine-type recombinase/integrase n=1 Tax=Ferrovibrio sp. TaxID=1917215 RepID=UPI001B5B5894|nr:tyrosine-type recombinase/integrase [Ferrovibrio sp.]MBP7065723.1 site-specific integrase [Ferrovibrio sp.]
MPFAEWPEEDRVRWRDMLSDWPEGNVKSASNLRKATQHKNQRGYGRWLTHLSRAGADLTVPPEARVTLSATQAYIAEMQSQGIKAYTIRGRIAELYSVISKFAPAEDWGWLKAIIAQLDAKARHGRMPEAPPVFTGQVVPVCVRELTLISETVSKTPIRDAVQYRNLLLMLVLSYLPLRRTSMAALELGVSFRRVDGVWGVILQGEHMKTGAAFSAALPSSINKFIELYIERYRPRLLDGASQTALWVTRDGTSMSDHQIYVEVKKATKKHLGVKLATHQFRDVAAQTLVTSNPENIELARALLSHKQTSTTISYYVVADGLVGSRETARLVRSLRAPK